MQYQPVGLKRHLEKRSKKTLTYNSLVSDLNIKQWPKTMVTLKFRSLNNSNRAFAQKIVPT